MILTINLILLNRGTKKTPSVYWRGLSRDTLLVIATVSMTVSAISVIAALAMLRLLA
ncbi:hypothetical protein FHR81_001737 [Actinoalloteichus hoggarensis]|uniref:Uncharacterized protein n=1 Tax=Actinoalloteichus hoggarensis TaxID=1470176 RepID=A0A221W5D7_9PSEU|nr:hypothetical protein AHOG_15715 [Actinoalloteichus hoggarensis]MBB5920699.1 hypothetical protein [Actinoalloteichus hoggarensis]